MPKKLLLSSSVLIHVNGVKDAVIESGYFAKVIDFGEILTVRSKW